uniref:C2 domain-containing protein n=1 Tax=Heterorhabditis bacteriophora TaxID=37862 RepID=A0A1I7XPH3_HETBA
MKVLIRVIEGRDITPESLRVHASFVGQQKATRTSTQGTPQWRQNLIFTVKDISLQSLSGERLTLKVTRIKNLSESVMGRFDCLLGAILCCPEKRIVSKWIALRAPLEGNEDSECDNCGFLKVSICVYGVNDSPLPMNDEEPSEEIWNRTQLENHTLRVRLFRLHHVANELNDIVASNKKKDKPTKFLIRVLVGDITTESSAEELAQYNMTEICTNSVIFDQELFLPVQLPTVISKASIPLRAIYESGEDGFLPTFGPAFINFFGYETLQEFKFKRNKKVGKEEDTSKYMARILCSVNCVEYLGETPQRNFLDYASCSYSKNFENLHHFSVYCSFLACNMINPQFSMDDVRFLVSMGEYGSTNAENDKNRSSTLGSKLIVFFLRLYPIMTVINTFLCRGAITSLCQTFLAYGKM